MQSAKKLRSNYFSIALIVGFLCVSTEGNAQDVWNGAGTWATAGNWSTGSAPTSGAVEIASGTCTITAAINNTFTTFTVDAGAVLELEATGTTITATTITVVGDFIMEEQGTSTTTYTITATNLNTSGSGLMENDGPKHTTDVINVVNLNLTSSSDFNMADANTTATCGTTIKITGNFTATNTAILDNSGGGSALNAVDFNGTGLQELNLQSNALPHLINFVVDGTNNTLQLEANMACSPKSTITISAGDTLDCQTFFVSGMATSGVFTLSPGSAIKIGSPEGLDGNISSSITTKTFNGSSNTFIYSGTASQVQGSLLPATVLNLTMHNTGGTENNGVTLSQSVTVTGQLTLDDGIIETTSTDILNLTGTAVTTCPSGNAISYVAGPMTETGATSNFVFPTGSFSSSSTSANRLAPIGITAPPSVSNTITAQYTYTTPVNPYSVNSPLTNVSTLEYWTMSETVATDAVTPTLYWQSGPASGIYTYTSSPLFIADYSTGGSIWNSLGGTGVTGTSPGAGTITATSSITGFSSLPVTFGSTIYSLNPLPISLTSFTANYEEQTNSVLINWIVASQLNNKEFVIEKTLDGINYTVLDTIAGAGTTSIPKSYSTIDNNPPPGTSYYRLTQIDFYGTSTDFPPTSVFIGPIASNGTVTIYPNPVIANANLLYRAEDSQPITVTLIDVTGRVVSSFINSQIKAGENSFSLNTANLTQGVYLVRVTNGQKTYQSKFIKE